MAPRLIPLLLACVSIPASSGDRQQTSGQELTTTEYTLEPGQERYVCWTFRSPPDRKAIVAPGHDSGPEVHHIVLSQAKTENGPEGSYECPELYNSDWTPIWAAGTGSNGFEMPEGVAFIVEPNTKYIAQLHLLNSQDIAVTNTSTVTLEYGAGDPNDYEVAGVGAVGTTQINRIINTSLRHM